MDKSKPRRTEITIETHSLTIIRILNGHSNSVFCQTCQATANHFARADASLIFRVEAGFLERLFRSGEIHGGDENLLCGNSLADYFRQQIRFIED